jgi:hypothetical protein
MEIQHHEPGSLPRQKRIKVSKACYTCRVKKIKVSELVGGKVLFASLFTHVLFELFSAMDLILVCR